MTNKNHSSLHHTFDIHLAEKYGIHEAIIIHHFQHWVQINMRLKRTQHEGKTWTYQTLDEIAAHFPYFSKSEVFEIIEKLCRGKGRRSKKKGLDFEPVLLKGNFNKHQYDKTNWYAFVNEEMFTVLAQAKMVSGSSQNGDQLKPIPIPDTITDTITDPPLTPPSTKRNEDTIYPKRKKTKALVYEEVLDKWSNENRPKQVVEQVIESYLKRRAGEPIRCIEVWMEKVYEQKKLDCASKQKDELIDQRIRYVKNNYRNYHLEKNRVYVTSGSIQTDFCLFKESPLWEKLNLDRERYDDCKNIMGNKER